MPRNRRLKIFTKDPQAVLDYKFDWKALTNGFDADATEDYLEDLETIASHTVTAEAGITVDSSSITDSATTVTAWLSGGTVGVHYTVTCQIVTSMARTDERSIIVKVEER